MDEVKVERHKGEDPNRNAKIGLIGLGVIAGIIIFGIPIAIRLYTWAITGS